MIGAIAIGVAGGLLGGLMGLGGGVLFVPGLVIFLDLTQHQAEATSLLAIIPVAIVGALMHDRHGDVQRRDGLLVGLLALAGVAGGVALANALSGHALRVAFAALLVVVAIQVVRGELRRSRAGRVARGGRPPRGATPGGAEPSGGDSARGSG